MRRLYRTWIAFLLLLIAPAPALAPIVAAAQQPVVLTFARPMDLVPIWHPVGFKTGTQYVHFQLIFNTLVKRAPDEKTIIPDLADSWDISADALTFTFHLHPGVKWQDGQPFSANDVVFTITQAVQQQDAYVGTYPISNWTSIVGADAVKNGSATSISGIEMPDPSTVRMTLTAPNVYFLSGLADPAYSIMPQHLLKDATAANIQQQAFLTQPIGTGPYKFAKYAPDQYVEFDANPDYFKGKPHIDQIFWKIMKPEVVASALQSGDVDLAVEINPQDRDRLGKDPNLKVLAVNGVGHEMLEYRVDNPLVADKRVREAIYYGFDRRSLLQNVFGGAGKILWLPQGFDQENIPGIDRYEYNPEKAKQLLEDANFNFDATFEIPYITDEPGWAQIAAALGQSLTDLGLTNVQLEPLDAAAWETRIAGSDFPVTLQCCGTLLNEDGQGFVFNCQKPRATNYANCDVDNLYAKGRATADPAARQDIYNQLAQILNTDVPYNWLWTVQTTNAASTRLGGGFEIYPNARESFSRVETWQLAPK